MLKRILAALLCVVLICLCVGCGSQTDDSDGKTTTKSAPEGEKVSIITETSEMNPELFAAANEMSKAYGDAVSITTYPDGYLTDMAKATQVAMAVAKDTSVTTIVFASGVSGTLSAVKQVRTERSDMNIIVCNPVENPADFVNYANTVLCVDFSALATDAVSNAKKAGATNFVFYATNRHLKYDSVATLRAAMEEACKKQGLTFKASASVDVAEAGRDVETAKLYIAEDAARVEAKLGKKTALFSIDPLVQDAVAKAAVTHGMVMPASFLPTPIAVAKGLDIDLSGHDNDAEYATAQLKENASAKGHIATWGCSVEETFLKAALDIALSDSETQDVSSVTDAMNANAVGTKIEVSEGGKGVYLIKGNSIVF